MTAWGTKKSVANVGYLARQQLMNLLLLTGHSRVEAPGPNLSAACMAGSAGVTLVLYSNLVAQRGRADPRDSHTGH